MSVVPCSRRCGRSGPCVQVESGTLRFRFNLLMAPEGGELNPSHLSESNVRRCVFVGALSPVPHPTAQTILRDCVPVGNAYHEAACEFRCCTIVEGDVCSLGPRMVLTDSIRNAILDAANTPYKIEDCDVFGEPPPSQGKNCFGANPQYQDPANLDYRLMRSSPCTGKASGGGDLGVRWTPEMLEMCEITRRLRRSFNRKPKARACGGVYIRGSHTRRTSRMSGCCVCRERHPARARLRLAGKRARLRLGVKRARLRLGVKGARLRLAVKRSVGRRYRPDMIKMALVLRIPYGSNCTPLELEATVPAE
jgi:hypothetical protein